MESAERFVGIDVSKKVLDIAVLRTGRSGASPTRRRVSTNWSPRSDPWRRFAGGAGIDGADPAAGGRGGARRGADPDGGGQSAPGAGLRQGSPADGWPRRTGWTRRSLRASAWPSGRVPPGCLDAEAQALEAQLERRRQVVTMITAEKNRLSSTVGPVRNGHPAPHRLAGKGVAQAGRGSEQAHPTELRYGGSERTCFGASPGWGRCSGPRSWRRSPSSGSWAASRSRACSGSPRSTATAGCCAGGAPCGEVGRRLVRPCTWPRLRPPATIR